VRRSLTILKPSSDVTRKPRLSKANIELRYQSFNGSVDERFELGECSHGISRGDGFLDGSMKALVQS